MSACEIQCFYHKTGGKCWTLTWIFQIQVTVTASSTEHTYFIWVVVILTECSEMEWYEVGSGLGPTTAKIFPTIREKEKRL